MDQLIFVRQEAQELLYDKLLYCKVEELKKIPKPDINDLESIKDFIKSLNDLPEDRVICNNSCGYRGIYASVTIGEEKIVYGLCDSTIKVLIEKGANINARDRDGWIPLRMATGKRNHETVALLKSYGAHK